MLESKQDKFFHHEITNVTNSGEKYLTTEAINFSLFIIITDLNQKEKMSVKRVF